MGYLQDAQMELAIWVNVEMSIGNNGFVTIAAHATENAISWHSGFKTKFNFLLNGTICN